MSTLNCGGRPLNLDRVAIMGIVNVTPDSFSDGGLFTSVDKAVRHAEQLVAEGADIVDIGGESTRPGAEAVSEQEELERVVPVIERLSAGLSVPISIDTSKPAVMQAAVNAGAGFINDVYALRAPGALEVAAQLAVPICLMHMKGEPRTMQLSPQYEDVVSEVDAFLKERITACTRAGVALENIVVDPGFGFGKSVDHNLDLLRDLKTLRGLNRPILAGLSRKSMIGKLLGLPVEDRVYASIALALIAIKNGASLLRVHDVAATVQAVRMFEKV